MFGSKILEEKKSKYNGSLKVIRAIGLGTYIQAENLTQSGGIIESMWRSTLKQVKRKKERVKSVLILGLGGGTIVKQIKKNWPAASITGVDIDKEIVELGKKYLKLDESLVKIKITDASVFLTHPSSLTFYDLVIVDLYNGDQFPKKFETDKFIKLIKHYLTSNGTVVFNRLYYKDNKLEAENFGKKLKRVFKNVEEYHPLVNLMLVCKN